MAKKSSGQVEADISDADDDPKKIKAALESVKTWLS
jgi:hypothetical protein